MAVADTPKVDRPAVLDPVLSQITLRVEGMT